MNIKQLMKSFEDTIISKVKLEIPRDENGEHIRNSYQAPSKNTEKPIKEEDQNDDEDQIERMSAADVNQGGMTPLQP